MLELRNLWILAQTLVLMKSQPKPKRERVGHLIPDHLALLENLSTSDTRCPGAGYRVSDPEYCDSEEQTLTRGVQALAQLAWLRD